LCAGALARCFAGSAAGAVWLGLLDRLESSALFSEESCSFSQSALLDHLDAWLAKAQETLGA
jgi:hypothetical protein